MNQGTLFQTTTNRIRLTTHEFIVLDLNNNNTDKNTRLRNSLFASLPPVKIYDYSRLSILGEARTGNPFLKLTKYISRFNEVPDF